MNDPIFSDIQNHWAQECIKQLQARNLISGYPDGTFRPNAQVTRAEFAALVRKAFPNTVPIRNAINFVDVPSSHWAYQAIQVVYRAGFLSGYPDRTFKPSQPIPRVQALVALVSGLKYGAPTNPSEILKKYFEDAAQIPNYAIGAIASATEKYLVVNYPNVRRFNPNQNATRGEIAALICRALSIPGVPLQYIPGMEFVVIQPQFDEAEAFSEGLARVKIADKWGYIDKTGKLVISPQFDEADAFSEGVALVRQYAPKRQ
ncbi:S-layer homology domain-containing protein [Trichocoleus sp. ST-U3]|uniref:S-layer homology domain-containing protein n=1 Tax=Coleofasciculus sp. FACHB-542 TaxID=2692787 RepID=UPI0016857CA3|nr:S-layer homology domain-containing protein [Coleofasciculus sp. FACHB-542]MBD2085891.1 S-layer homology domain-containing protein [Coleofasciculus sp. FACHB-542]